MIAIDIPDKEDGRVLNKLVLFSVGLKVDLTSVISLIDRSLV